MQAYSKASLNLIYSFLKIVTLSETMYNEANFPWLIDINKS